METQVPAPDVVRGALDRIATSRTFARAQRAVRLLGHVVQKAASGQAGGIKEYTIALEFFERADYDPKIDSLVRVEASKLRELLAKYYETEGRDDRLRIEIPKGHYAPVFHEIATTVAAPPAAPRKNSNVRFLMAAGVLIAALLAGAAWRWGGPSRRPPVSTVPLSIAVLPFLDMSPAKDQQYLSDGLTEELINVLAGMEGLRVAARTSVFQYKGKEKDVRRIGEELKVQAVLEGSVRMEGRQIRVTAQLISTDDGFHLWTNTYDRDLRDIFDIERNIAAAIGTAFNVDLRGTTRALVRPRTQNPEAWHYYLRASHLSGAGGPEELVHSIEFYKAAVSADPNYAMAWARLAHAWTTMADWGQAQPETALVRAQEAARRAVELDANLSEAHQAIARVKIFYERDRSGAEKSFQRAIELDPTGVEARYDYARLILTPNERFDEAAEQLRRAIAMDPGEIALYNGLANSYIKSRRYDEALEPLAISRKFAPKAPSAMVMQGMAAVGAGRYAEALLRFKESAAIVRGSWVLGHLGYTLAKMGRREEARIVLAELEGTKPLPTVELAAVNVALGENDRALAFLEQAYSDFSTAMLWIKVDFRMDPLRANPRFDALLQKMRLNTP